MTLNPKLDPSCVLCLPFEEPDGSIAYDISNYGNHGTIYGATRTLGKLRKGLSFNGSTDYMEGNLVQPLSEFSIEAWVKPLRIPSTGADRYVFFGDLSGGKNVVFLSQHSNPNTAFYSSGYDSAGNYWSVSNIASQSKDSWMHFVITYKANVEVKAYLNGVFIKTGIVQGPISSTKFRIGRDNGGFYGNAVIDEVRIYSRALSAKEVYTHYIYGIQRLRQPRFPEFRKEIRRKLWPGAVV
jgi:hypothetical protein